MKLFKILFLILTLFLPVSSNVVAGDFDWFKDFNIKAELDPSGIRARLATRFKIGAAEIEAVLSNVEKPSDAYMIFRLGEMSNQPTSRVVEKYNAGKGKGWGVIAKSLGIKPGSREFKALKGGHDLQDAEYTDKDKSKSKDKAKRKSKTKGGKKKNKGKGKK